MVVVTICIGASAKEARKTLKELKVRLITLMDEDGQVATRYRIRGTPTTYLIDGTGAIQMAHIGHGSSSEKTLRTEIQSLLEE